jgi:hypothetical protein
MDEEAYRREALRVLDAFLFMYPRERNFLEDYPGVLTAIKDYYKQGIAPSNAGVQIGAVVRSSQIAGMDPADRTIIKKQLRELSDEDREQFRKMAREGGSGKLSFSGDGIMLMTALIATSMAFARDALDHGQIGPVTFEAAETEIFGALDGMRDAPNRGDERGYAAGSRSRITGARPRFSAKDRTIPHALLGSRTS